MRASTLGVITASAFFCSQLLAQSGPSLKETVDFIGSKILNEKVSASMYFSEIQHLPSSVRGFGSDFTFVGKTLSVDGCTLKVTYETTYSLRKISSNVAKSTSIYVTTSAEIPLASVMSNSAVVKGEEYPAVGVKLLAESAFETQVLDKADMVYWVQLGTGGKKVLRIRRDVLNYNNLEKVKEETDTREEHELTLAYFTDEQLARRVAKAVSHAATVCGAKAEPF